MPPKEKALEKKALNEAEKARKADEEREKQEAAEWNVGARDNARARAAEEKEAERLKKASDLAALKAEDEAELGGIKTVKKVKKKGKDDFDLLNAALAVAPKSKAQKEAEEKKKLLEERKKADDAAREAKEARLKAQQAEIDSAAKRGIVMNHTDSLMVPINNRLEDDEDDEGFLDVSGLDGAISALSAKGGAVDEHPERRQKALYNAFYATNLPILKEEQPGLKLSQYKERLFDMWQSSSENPKNQKAR